MADHDLLIEKLSRSAGPVKRPLPTRWRVACWMAIALPCGAIASLLVQRTLTDWTQPGVLPTILQLLLSFLLGVLAIRSAFNLSIPGRRVLSWKVFVPLIVLWLIASSSNLSAEPLLANIAEGTGCYRFMLVVSLPMIAIMIASLRRTRTLYPLRSLAMAGFGVACMAMTMLAFCHPLHFHPLDLLMHLAAIASIVALTMVGGKRWVRLQVFTAS
ncbi:NrsF family protein [Erwiniaceae bacterium BAC15a-03b]|uniref:NrsF family protein n=1 Tax=Winslowiella arboricola TaxID=2978220 RepID=A0A9J6PNJ8_9GAMM|nr:NrsF family protein [Winslowiella arboricola]MCU5773996.1 NrsF family protein [Winslowiella arboricola]MCU5777277.1 NrsF family protein [Winslowiella arboricola]